MDPMTAMMLGQMVLGAAGTAAQGQQAASQAVSQSIEFQNNEFARRMQNDAQNANINAANNSKLVNNRTAAQALGTNRGAQEFALDYNYRRTMESTSVKAAKIKATANSLTDGRNLSPKSGSTKAINRMSTDNYFDYVMTTTFGKDNTLKSLRRNVDASLASLDGYMQQENTFVPGIDGSADPNAILDTANASAMLQLAFAATGTAMAVS